MIFYLFHLPILGQDLHVKEKILFSSRLIIIVMHTLAGANMPQFCTEDYGILSLYNFVEDLLK